jgi:hypothetical protein
MEVRAAREEMAARLVARAQVQTVMARTAVLVVPVSVHTPEDSLVVMPRQLRRVRTQSGYPLRRRILVLRAAPEEQPVLVALAVVQDQQVRPVPQRLLSMMEDL